MSKLFGRAQECARLDTAVAGARRGEGGSLIITGGHGTGKSALLDYVMNSADDIEVIRIEGLESEAQIGLAGLQRLLLFHPERRSVLPPAQRRALDASLGLADQPGSAPFLLGLAVLTMLNDLSRSRLVVCLVDDAHWLDPESAQVLAFVARRLQNEKILMLFAARDQPESSVTRMAFGSRNPRRPRRPGHARPRRTPPSTPGKMTTDPPTEPAGGPRLSGAQLRGA